ncbi:MAG: FliH/SctL family protein [Nannocystales bacterium]
MSKLRPFTPPQSARAGSGPAPAPRFPGAATEAPQSTPTAGRPYKARPLDNTSPEVDLQVLLDAAQRQVDALQSKNAAQSATFEQERSKFHGAVQTLEQSRARACRVLAKDAVALAVEIAHALAGRAFEVDQSKVTSLLETALVEFSSEHPIRVRVAPSEVAHVKTHLETQEASFVHVDPDPAMSPGDLIVEAEQLVVDARLTERIATLREELAAAVRSDEALQDDPNDEATDEPQPSEATP